MSSSTLSSGRERPLDLTKSGVPHDRFVRSRFRLAPDGTTTPLGLAGMAPDRGWLALLDPGHTDVERVVLRHVDDAGAVLLRQRPAFDGPGGDVDVLAGPRAMMRASEGTVVSRVDGWSRVDLAAVPSQTPGRAAAHDSLRGRALDDADRLARLVAWWLAAGSRLIVVSGVEAPARLPLLWGLARVAESMDVALQFDSARPAPGSVDGVLVVGDPTAARLPVDLATGEVPSHEVAARANELVFRLEFGSAPAAADVPPPLPFGHPRPGATQALALAGATSAGEVRWGLAALEHVSAGPGDGTELRGVLDSVEYCVPAILRHYPPVLRAEAIDRVVRVAFAADLASADPAAAGSDLLRLMAATPHDALARALDRLAAEAARPVDVTGAVTARWRRDGLEVPEEPEPVGLLAGWAARVGVDVDGIDARRFVLGSALVCAIVLLVGVVLGSLL